MKRKWFGDRAHIDEDKVETRTRVKDDLRNLMETGDEEGYVAYIKALKPSLSPEELVRQIQLFRELRRGKR